MKRVLALSAAVALTLVASACGGADPLERNQNQNDDTLTIGSADIAESELLMEIYAEALRTTGTEVQTKARIGAREFYFNAVKNGELDVIPEYTGNTLKFVDSEATATESKQVYETLQRALPEQMTVLQQSPAEDSDVLTVTRATAQSGLRSMSDLGPRCGELVLGAPAEWKERWKTTIAEVYDCEFKRILPLEAGNLTVDALNSGQVQVANLFTTSSSISQNDLVKLDDPKNMFPAQNVVPLVHEGSLNQEQIGVLNKVSAALDTEKLTDLNRELEVEKANPADLAKEFVSQAGL